MSQLFVVECYDDTGTPGHVQPLPAAAHDVLVVCAVRVPEDDVVIALVEGADEHTTCAALVAAGWRVDRIVSATWMRLDEVP